MSSADLSVKESNLSMNECMQARVCGTKPFHPHPPLVVTLNLTAFRMQTMPVHYLDFSPVMFQSKRSDASSGEPTLGGRRGCTQALMLFRRFAFAVEEPTCLRVKRSRTGITISPSCPRRTLAGATCARSRVRCG